MRAVVVYESACGGAREVARAIADNLIERGAAVETIPAAAAPAAFERPVGLLVVGAPAPTFALPGQSALGPARSADIAGHRAGVGDWIERVRLPNGQPTATFDIRVDRRISGSAARAAARRLRERGAAILRTETFHAAGAGRPLDSGEVVRARAWAADLVVEAAVHRVG